MMTIDEAIKSYREIAEKSRKIGKSLFDKLNDEIGADWYEHQAEEKEQLAEWFEELKALQEKATAKKPIYDESYDGLCPNCKNMAFRDVWWYENDKPVNYSHCHFCGQKIDWAEEEVNDNGRD